MAVMQWKTLRELETMPIPETLWHYTSLDAFRQIIESGNLFATHVQFVNDIQEVVHARMMIDEMLRKDYHPDIRQQIQDATDFMIDLDLRVSLVTSFTASENQLSQWRGYSGGSSGVSIGFDLRTIRTDIPKGRMAYFAPCVYDEQLKETLVREALAPITDRSTVNDSESTHAFQNTLNIVPILKHHKFEEEKEWRLIISENDRNSMKFRTGRSTLIPYVEIPIKQYVTHVMLGPGSDANAEKAIALFVEKHDIKGVRVQRSDVPYLLR